MRCAVDFTATVGRFSVEAKCVRCAVDSSPPQSVGTVSRLSVCGAL